jgi:hypothetical protein
MPGGEDFLRGMRLEMEPGEGNLQLHALFAAIIGPHRIAHGSKRTVRLEADETKRIINIAPAARHCAYIALFLPASANGPLSISVGREDTQGDSAGIPVQLEPRMGATAGVSFGCVLLPGESLYAQSAIDVSFILSEVSF